MTEPDMNRLPNVFVVIMGPSGSGKSHLIDLLLGTTDPKNRIANESLDPKTRKIKGYQYWNPPEGLGEKTYCITFIDTPGAREANNSDEEVSQMVFKWMEAHYGQIYPIGAVLYLKRSQDTKEPSASFVPKVFENMFRPRGGHGSSSDQPVNQLSLVMTHWDCVNNTEKVGKLKADLEKKHWADLIAAGARSDIKDDNSTVGAWRIVARALKPYLEDATTANIVDALTDEERKAYDKLSRAMEKYQACLSIGDDASTAVAAREVQIALDAVTGYRSRLPKWMTFSFGDLFK